MDYLSKQQLLMLEKLSKMQSISVSDLSLQEFNICKFFESRGFVDIEKISHGVNYNGIKRQAEPVSVAVTESGKAFLSGLQIDETRYRRAYRLSIISIAISVTSLLVSALSMCITLS